VRLRRDASAARRTYNPASMAATGERGGIRAHWDSGEAARFYRAQRWSSARKRERDPRLVDRILARHLDGVGRDSTAPPLVLDVPCGAGRLAAVLAAHGSYVGVDLSPAMLAEARKVDASSLALLRGEIQRLPFADGSFDAVVCCRLLHHVREPEHVADVLRELCRVSRRLVVASFWDAGTLPAWRRRVLPGEREARRFAHGKVDLESALAGTGADVIAWRHHLRFFSRQTFLVAEKRSRGAR